RRPERRGVPAHRRQALRRDTEARTGRGGDRQAEGSDRQEVPDGRRHGQRRRLVLQGRAAARGRLALASPHTVPPVRELSRQGDLEIVGSYRFSHEAHLARAALDAAGIRAWVLDEAQIRMRWFMGDALGGIKVAVRREEAADARALLARDFSVEL